MGKRLSVSVATALLGALLVAVILAVLHLLAPRLRHLPGVPEAVTASFAGGISVSYVFLHLLPDLAEGNKGVAEALRGRVEESPLLDLGIFLVALAGFVVFYGLQRLADRSAGHPSAAAGTPDATADPPGGVFALHLAAFAVYNGLITYTMPLRLRTGLVFGILFSVAMGLHFVLTDRGLTESYPRRFRRWGRYFLALALLAGWGLAAIAAPTNVLVVSLMTAFLGGSILLNVFKEELPSDRDSSFAWFFAGLAGYAGLLAAVTAVSE